MARTVVRKTIRVRWYWVKVGPNRYELRCRRA